MLNSSEVAALTDHHIFRGTIITGSRRLSDTLNDTMTKYVEMEDVKVFALAAPNKPSHTSDSMHVKKRRLLLIAIIDEDIQQPTGRLYSYVEKIQRPSIIFVEGFQISGTMFFSGRGEGSTPFVSEGETFIPVTNATIRSMTNQRVRIRASTVLINLSSIDGYFYEDQ